MSGVRGECDLCQKKKWSILRFKKKHWDKNSYENGKKKKQKQKKQSLQEFEPGASGIGSDRLTQWATQTSLANPSNLQYIQCYRNSKYELSVFSAIFRHKQPQNVDLKQLALLKWIYYDNLEKTFTVYQRNACKSIIDDRGRAGLGENDLCQKKTLCSARPARHASACR